MATDRSGNTRKETPAQTAGPYWHIGMAPSAAGLDAGIAEIANVLTFDDGEPIVIEGLIRDGEGAPVTDALIELWQADAQGVYDTDGHSGFGRAICDLDTGQWRFETIKPGATPYGDDRMQAPHVSLLIHARGLNIHLHTRMYFADEEAANADDPLLNAIDDPDRRETLIAAQEEGGDTPVYRFEISLQGDNETVFLDM